MVSKSGPSHRPTFSAIFLAALILARFAATQAYACAKTEATKDLSSYVNPSQNLDERITVRTSIGRVYHIPLGYLGLRSVFKNNQANFNKQWGYYFCFPSGGYSVPDMGYYFPVALQEYEVQSLPISVDLQEFDPQKYEPQKAGMGVTSERTVQNARQVFQADVNVAVTSEFGLLKFTRHSSIGTFEDYVSENDPTYNVIAAGNSPYMKSRRPSAVIRVYNRNTGIEMLIQMPLPGLEHWREIVGQTEKHLREWFYSK